MQGFPGGSDGKVSACNVADPGSTPGSGRSPGEGDGNPLQYSCLENSMDGGAWWAEVHEVTKSQNNWVTSLNNLNRRCRAKPYSTTQNLLESPDGGSCRRKGKNSYIHHISYYLPQDYLK